MIPGGKDPIRPGQSWMPLHPHNAALQFWLELGVPGTVLFALTVTVSVQLVGLYLVFATLIGPPLGTRRMVRHRLAAAWTIGVAGYAAGLVASTTLDLPTGPVIVWTLVAFALCWDAVTASQRRDALNAQRRPAAD